jgi:serine/threonine protein kinase
MSADRNLLFGMLALHAGLVSREQMLDAFNAWVARKEAPLGQLLCERGALDEDARGRLDGLVDLQLRRHGDARKGLAALRIDPEARRDLGRLADPDVQAGLALLAAGQETTPPGPATAAWPRAAAPAADALPPAGLRYRRLRSHAKGGLGEVFVALDEELRREVALKEIQARFADDPDARARFLREAEVTGNLEHPGVVPVYGLGAYPDGRPLYAMRFIKGESMQVAVARFHEADSRPGRDPGERGLALRDLLGRFVAACNAVGYAHARGVVHRDFKPANVMLGEFGETLVVDWGLARAFDQPRGERTTAGRTPACSGGASAPTQVGQVVGTPAYMPPEQANGQLDRVGPASDVFSLGATLYCLLTGQPPYAGADVLVQAALAEVVPARRRNPRVPRALEAVCAKAMAARPEDRYPTALALAQDVERFLADEPVSAFRDPLPARLGRWARKNRTLVTTAAGVLLVALAALSVGLAVVGGLNQKLEAANADLKESNESLEAARAQAQERRLEAERERNVAVAVNDFLQRDLLGQADIGNQPFPADRAGRNPNITVGELLDRAAKAVDGKFTGQPQTEAAIRLTIGDAYQALGRYESAQAQLERAVALRERALGPDHLHTLTSKNNLALLYHYQAKFDRAEPLYVEVLRRRERQLGAEHPETLATRHNLASVYRDQRKYGQAEALFLQLLRQQERALGAGHLNTLSTKNAVGGLFWLQGKYGQAEPLFLEVMQQMDKRLGPDHPMALMSKHNLASVYRDQGKYDKAEPLFLQVLRQMEKVGADHPEALNARHSLAQLYAARSENDRAEPLFREAHSGAVRILGFGHPRTQTYLQSLLSLYRRWGKPEKAQPLLQRRVDFLRARAGLESPAGVAALEELGKCLLAREDHAGAEKVLADCLRVSEKTQPDRWTTFNTRSALGEALTGLKKYGGAEPLLLHGYQGLEQRVAQIPPAVRAVRLKEALERLVRLYEATGKKDEAARWQKKLDEVKKDAAPQAPNK